MNAPLSVNAKFPPAFKPLFRPARYKVFWGGRGSGKSFNFARALIILASKYPLRVLCTREYQSSLKDSVHALLKAQAEELGLMSCFDFTRDSVKSAAGAEFIFMGLHLKPAELKSLHGIDICWVEEAHAVTEDSWTFLIPTIRSEGRYPWLPTSEIWISFNQGDETDPTYKRFVTNRPDNAFVVPVTWKDNPYFPGVLDLERQYMLRTDPDAYEWVWGLSTRKLKNSLVLGGKFVIETFEDPKDPPPDRLFFGMDFGFSVDPSAAVRMYMTDEPAGVYGPAGKHLWISHEAYGHGVELVDLPKMLHGGTDCNGTTWPGLPGANAGWPIKADNSRPETISYMAGEGVNISEAAKWSGSVEDGITYLRGFVKIHIHERCIYTAQEARLYSYKVDQKSNDVLPQVVDKHNHTWDGVRYGLDGYITASDGLGTWQRLAQQAA